ncbi:MAG: HNH endonuclease [Blastocatellia bacterium]
MNPRYLPEQLRQRVADSSKHRCGYCLSEQQYSIDKFEIEHIIPLALGGTNDESNLWLSCGGCNNHKWMKVSGLDPDSGEDVPLFNPRTQQWAEHFRWDETCLFIIGRTPIGRATVVALRLNNELAVRVRGHWVNVGWHPPADSI